MIQRRKTCFEHLCVYFVCFKQSIETLSYLFKNVLQPMAKWKRGLGIGSANQHLKSDTRDVRYE